MKREQEEITILISGQATRKEIAESLKRVIQVLRKSPAEELNLGWGCEPVRVNITLQKR